jgi:hypothetical protein
MLNDRQIDLYKFLLTQHSFISKKEICKAMPYHYPRHLEHNNNEGNKSVAFGNISKDIRAINNSDDIENVVIGTKKGYKIATHEEAKKYIESRFKRDLKSLKLNWKLKRKVNIDGQLRFEDEDIKEVMTFIKGGNNEV